MNKDILPLNFIIKSIDYKNGFELRNNNPKFKWIAIISEMIESRVEEENLECLYEGLEIDKQKSGLCRIIF